VEAEGWGGGEVRRIGGYEERMRRGRGARVGGMGGREVGESQGGKTLNEV